MPPPPPLPLDHLLQLSACYPLAAGLWLSDYSCRIYIPLPPTAAVLWLSYCSFPIAILSQPSNCLSVAAVLLLHYCRHPIAILLQPSRCYSPAAVVLLQASGPHRAHEHERTPSLPRPRARARARAQAHEPSHRSSGGDSFPTSATRTELRGPIAHCAVRGSERQRAASGIRRASRNVLGAQEAARWAAAGHGPLNSRAGL